MTHKLVIATTNPGKVKEFADFFAPERVTVLSLKDFPEIPEIEETGTTFLENASIKASTAAKYLNLPVIADDSGLSVDALLGAPGIYSARYAGEEKNDKKNRDKLVAAISNFPENERQGHFICALAVADASGEIIADYEGSSDGLILTEERGENGFGYDSLFYVPEKKATMAEMTPDEKGQLSHRGKAVRQLIADYKKGALRLF